MFAQSIVEGRVLDKTTSKPLLGVNIFFSKTTWGSTTSEDGYYSIKSMPPGKYELVVSMIGYETERQEMSFNPSENFTMNFRLSPQSILMNEIIVTSKSNKEWRKNYSVFKKSFLGSSRNGEQCTILNEYVLSFTNNDNYFKAVASQPLEIENSELGYKIFYYLDDFEIYDGLVRFAGDHFFVEMDSKSKRQRKKWNKKRRIAYNGSMRHFLKTLNDRYEVRFTEKDSLVHENPNWKRMTSRMSDPVYREGFSIYLNKKNLLGTSLLIKSDYGRLKNEVLVFPSANNRERIFSFKGRMMIVYAKESEDLRYSIDNSIQSTHQQTSYILLKSDSVRFDSKGRYFEPYMIEQQGYSAWERVGDQLPFNYEIK